MESLSYDVAPPERLDPQHLALESRKLLLALLPLLVGCLLTRVHEVGSVSTSSFFGLLPGTTVALINLGVELVSILLCLSCTALSLRSARVLIVKLAVARSSRDIVDTFVHAMVQI